MNFFALLQHELIQNAFLAGTVIAIIAAIVGYFVVLRAQAFAGEALTDIGFAGATGAALLGFSAFVGMLIMTLLSALGIGALSERMRGRDVEVGMVLSFALGLGVLFLTLYTSQNSAKHASAGFGILFGSILVVERKDVWIALGCGIVVLLILALLFRPLLFASIDPVVAQTRGVPVQALSIIFLLLLGVTVAESVLVVGVLLVFALLVAPAAAAQRFARSPLMAILLAVALGLLCTWGGITLSLVLPGKQLPVSFYISTLASLTYFASLLWSRQHAQRTQRRAALEAQSRSCRGCGS